MNENTNKVVDWMKNNWLKLLLVVSGFIIIILITSTTCTRRENKNLINNIKALTDSVQTLTLKNGDLAYAKQSLILEKEELEKYLNISQQEIKDLEKKLGSKVSVITQIQSTIKIDTLKLHDSIYIGQNRDTIISSFAYNDDWVGLGGSTVVIKDESSTILDSIGVNVPLKLGLTDDYKVFVTSSNPYVSIKDIDAAVIEGSVAAKKPKRFGLSVQVGVGVGYDIIHNNFSAGPYVGVGLSYNFLQF